MSEKKISTPITAKALTGLRIGDIVYLSGTLITGRDDVYQRIVLQGRPSPVDLHGLAVYHAGPIVQKAQAEWKMISAGPTTSMRMESCQGEFLKTTGAKLIIGKGGMGTKTAGACRVLKAVHTVFPGGCAALAAACVETIEAVHWLDLGMAEAMWVLRVKDFGPLIVSIDTKGNNLFEENKSLFEKQKKTALQNFVYS